MGMFETVKMVPVSTGDISAVANETISHFKGKAFEIKDERLITGGWYISISKGKAFKSVLGMKTALNIEIEPIMNGTRIKAGVGVFGQQIIPSVISLFIAWPVLIAQIWGMVQQSKLDDEAVLYIEESLYRHSSSSTNTNSTQNTDRSFAFCTQCGTKLEAGMKFCPECGTKF